MGVTELNEILLNSMPQNWSQQAYVQGFYCETISFEKAVNMFEHMEIAESIYQGVVTPSYKKLPGKNPTILDSVGIREDKPPFQNPPPQNVRSLASAVNNI